MSKIDPELPLDLPRTIPDVRMFVGGAEIISSGSAIIPADTAFKLRILDLEYEISFLSVAGEEDKPRTEHKITGEKSLQINLINFDNMLGTTLSNMHIGSVYNRKLFLSVYAQQVSSVHLMSYTVSWDEAIE